MQPEPRTSEPTAAPEPIAIVGIGLRLPGGAESPEEFDEFLKAGRTGIRPVPEDRWDVAAFRPDGPDEKGKIITTNGGFLDRIDVFDTAFFNISPKEARYIDPQQRMVLETAWHALEHANIDPTPLRHGNGGVYIGVSSFDYALRMGALPYEELDGHLAAGCTIFSVSGRLSYFLGWRGPCVSVDSACSSSLSALHLAVQGLRNGECDIALSGGVNSVHHPSFMVMFSNGQMLAADGRCKTFDESADGYSRGEGCAIVVLKRLSDAERDGDTVLALIRGTAIGQDGDSAGLTVPHGPAQELTIRNALAAARLCPGDIQYVEAHGTGTPLGDPIELGAINAVFAKSHSETEPLLVGSVKTNVGHLEPASGIVGLVKTVLQLRSGTIYPHLNFTEPSRRIPWDTYPVAVPTTCLPWRACPRRAVVNSFGFAGTIAVAVLEEATSAAIARGTAEAEAAGPAETAVGGVFTVSAKNAAGLHRQIDSYLRFASASPDSDVARLCYTANVGRAHLPHRLAGVVTTRSDLVRLLTTGREKPPAAQGIRKVAFLFSGQGTQHAGMGASLYRRFRVFAEQVDECDRLFAPHLAESVRALILGTSIEPELINQTEYTQPALFSYEYALARLWLSWGVTPSVMLGHSIGEVTAAAVSGLLALPDAVTLVAARARVMQSVRAAGGMAAVALPADDVAPLVADHPELALAAINAPGQCVVSGASAPLSGLVAELRGRSVRVDELTVSHAFHSPLMADASRDFARAISGLKFRQPGIPVISNVTGSLGRFADMGTAEYWARHIGEPVRFMDGVRAAEERGRHAFVEIGPSTALIALAKSCVSAQDHCWVASARRRDPKDDAILRAIAELYSAGLSISWPGVHADTALRKTRLPDYPFEQKRYWLPAGSGAAAPDTEQNAGVHPLLGREDTADAGPRTFVAAYTADRPTLLSGYATGADPAIPSAAYVEILLAMQDAVSGSTRGLIRDLRLHEPLQLPADGQVELRTVLVPAPDGTRVEMTSGPGGHQIHATAIVAEPGKASADAESADTEELRALAEAPGAVEETSSGEDIYTDFASLGRRYGERYRLVTQVSRHAGGTVTAEVRCRRASAAEHLPPEVLECALHAVTALDDDGPDFVPASFGSIRLFTKPRGARLRVVARVAAAGDQERRADLMVLDGEVPVVTLLDVLFRRSGRPGGQAPFLHRLAWLRHGLEPALQADASRHLVVLGADPARLAGLAGPDVRLTCLTDADELAATLRNTASQEPVTDVCWLWRPRAEAMSVTRMRAECEENYRGLLAVLGALRPVSTATPPRLWLVTERAQWLPGDRPGQGEQLPAATLWGFGHVLLNEDPRLKTTLLDLDADADLAALADECRAPATSDFQIAYRGRQRFVRRLLAGQVTPEWDAAFDLDGVGTALASARDENTQSVVTLVPGHADPGLPAPRKTATRPDRTYLITGLGGLALATAHKLADLGARRIVLASRSGRPAPETSDDLGTLSTRCEVTIRKVDLGDADEVRRLVAEANPGDAPLGGVVHAAGLAGKSLVAGLTWEAIDEQLRAQAYGGWLLHEATQDLDLDFFVVHSSIAAVIGGATQAHYAAAFAFLDGLLTWRARQGLPGIAINWGMWARVGMSARLEKKLAGEIERTGILFFSPARALRTLHRLILSEPGAHYVGGVVDWNRMASLSPIDDALYARVAAGRRGQPADSGSETAIDLTGLAGAPGPERLAAIGSVVRDSVAAAMQADEEDEIDPAAEFVALGMDSLMAVELRNRLESAFRLPLPASLTFDYPSPQHLTEFIDSQFAHAGQ